MEKTMIDIKQAGLGSVQATIKRKGKLVEKEWNGKKYKASQGGIVIVNGTEFWCSFPEEKYNKFSDNDTIIGSYEQGKDGTFHYKWSKMGGEQVKADPLPDEDWTNLAPCKENKPEQQDIQDRIIRGMCFNNASTLVYLSGQYVPPKEVKEYTKDLYSEMKDWLQGSD